jgi:hypothetical protein
MRPRILDLFCGAGGCGTGYAWAGFDVVGVDFRDQPRYPFEFHQADALTYPLAGFDAIHASPPCQHYAGVTRWRGKAEDHPDLVAKTRDLLDATGLPWVMENVREAPIRGDILLCGTALGLPVRRHRHFETNWSGVLMVPPCQHRSSDYAFEHKQERAYADAMECDWMSSREAREAIPPRYTEWIGQHLHAYLQERAA